MLLKPHLSFLRATALCIALFAVACVSPPLHGGPSADARLEALLQGADDLQDRELYRGVRALSLDHPRHVPTLLADAALTLEAGQPGRAMALLDSALAIEPDNVDAVLLATRETTKNGDLAGARRRIKAALNQRPDEPLLHESDAAILFLEGRHKEAVLALDKADALADELSWRSSYHRGLIAEAQENNAEAEAHFARCLKLAPGFEPAARRQRALKAAR